MQVKHKFSSILAVVLSGAMLLSACGQTAQSPAAPAPGASAVVSAPAGDAAMKDGTYTAVGAGFGGDIKMEITVVGGAITAATVLENSETPDVAAAALAKVPQAIVAKQSAEVDVVTGATLSSKGIIEAAQKAINQSKGIAEVAALPILENPDVIVVGGGVAGMMSALEAATNGAKVLLFEKTGKLGGTFGGSTLSGANTKMQQEAGIMDDTADKFFADFVRLNEGYKKLNPTVKYSWNESLGRYYAENSGPAVDWLDSLGVDMKDRKPSQPTLYEPLSIPRVYSGDRKAYSDVVFAELSKFVDMGQVSIVLKTTVTDLTMDGTTVTGVKTKNEAGEEKDYLAKATILCTGGYGHAPELVEKYNYKNFTTTAPAFATGDGFVMAEKAGGVLKNMDFLTAYAGGLKTPEDGITKRLSIRVKDFPNIIFVNAEGNRFVDELGPEDGTTYDEISSWWKKGEVYIVLDQGMVDSLKADKKSIISGDKEWKEFDDQLAKGNVLFGGATPTEAATKAGVNGANLEKTITRYNGFVKNGKDADFGRTRLMTEFTGGTYYIFKTTPYIMITAGGPDMNDKAEVLNASGAPILGLYQAGEIVGMANAYGRTTVGGVGNTGSIVWGKLAGGSAAKYALAK